MGVITGLKSITSALEDAEGGSSVRWLSLNDKDSVRIIFLQELDPDAEHFSAKNGLAVLALEHSAPQNFRNKALCSIDSGECYGCEKHAEDWKAGWKQKVRLYANVLVDNGTDDPYVAILSQGNGAKAVTPNLIEHATEFDTVTDKWFRLKRTGKGVTDTSYTLTALKEHDHDVESFELIDIQGDVLKTVPYEDQQAFYAKGSAGTAAVDEGPAFTPSNSGKSDAEDW